MKSAQEILSTTLWMMLLLMHQLPLLMVPVALPVARNRGTALLVG